MAVRNSEYEPMPMDFYATPEWVTEALLSAEIFGEKVWEPACGRGHIEQVLRAHQYDVVASDVLINSKHDFIDYEATKRDIITNPPYSNGLAEKFVRHALRLTEPVKGKVAMLLPLAWDSAKGRRDLFADHPAFKVKYTLTSRIRWANLEQKKNGPSQNHAWFVWDWSKDPTDDPVCGYLP